MKLYATAQESKTGKTYYALIADLGYRKVYLTMDRNLIAELCCISMQELMSKEVGWVHAIDTE